MGLTPAKAETLENGSAGAVGKGALPRALTVGRQKTRLRGSGYTNPRYPTRPKDIHLENLERVGARCGVGARIAPPLMEATDDLFFRELVHLIAWRPLMRILPPYGQPELPHTPIHARPAPLMPFSTHTA